MNDMNGQVEQALLAALLRDFEQLQVHAAFSILRTQDFEFPGHGLFFDAFKALAQSGHRVTALSLSEYLNRQGKLGDFITAEYIQALDAKEEAPEMIEDYSVMIRDAAVMRSLREAGMQIQQSVGRFENPDEAIVFSQGELIKVAERSGIKKPFTTAADIADEAMAELEQRIANPTDIIGIETGFKKFDWMTTGLQKEDLWIIGARPSMGKTAFLLNAAEHMALRKRIPVLMFSAEMPKEKLMLRLLSSVAEIDGRDLRMGRLNAEQKAKLQRAIREVKEAPLFINDESYMTPGRIKLISQQVMMQNNCQLGFIGVDYLQLLHPDKAIGKGDNANMNITEISRKLKQNARDLKLPLACLSQLSRSLESRQDKRPMLSDLRDSGSIEQDADIVTFIYRDEYYNKDTKKPGVAEILLAKQREGETGTFELTWDHKRTKFRNPHISTGGSPTYKPELPPL